MFSVFLFPLPPTQCGLIPQVCQNVDYTNNSEFGDGVLISRLYQITWKISRPSQKLWYLQRNNVQVFIVLSMSVKIKDDFQNYPGCREGGTTYLQLLNMKQNKWLSIVILREFHALCCY